MCKELPFLDCTPVFERNLPTSNLFSHVFNIFPDWISAHRMTSSITIICWFLNQTPHTGSQLYVELLAIFMLREAKVLPRIIQIQEEFSSVQQTWRNTGRSFKAVPCQITMTALALDGAGLVSTLCCHQQWANIWQPWTVRLVKFILVKSVTMIVLEGAWTKIKHMYQPRQEFQQLCIVQLLVNWIPPTLTCVMKYISTYFHS